MIDIVLTVLLQSVILGVMGFVGYRILKAQIAGTIYTLIEELFSKPVVKASMSNLGKKSGEVRADKAVVDEMMEGVIDSPQMSALRMGLDQVGIDIDGMTEKYGTARTMQGLMQIAQMFGIDVGGLLAGGLQKGLSGSTPQSSGDNPYLKG